MKNARCRQQPNSPDKHILLPLFLRRKVQRQKYYETKSSNLLVFVMRFGVSLYELCISAPALSIEFNAVLTENESKERHRRCRARR